MVASIERIEKDLAALEAAIVAIAQEFHKTYASYLDALGKTTRQQLILASYYLCTQAYPRQFLHLSVSHRQELQQTVRQLATQTQQELLAKLMPPLSDQQPSAPPPEGASIELAEIPVLEPPASAEPPQDQPAETGFLAPEFLGNEFSKIEPSSLAPDAASPTLFAISLSAPTSEATVSLPRAEPHTLPKPNPLEELRLWQETLEREIGEELRSLSHAVNRLFQQTGILPRKLPEPILEAAIRAEATEVIGGPPNLLNLMVETVSDRKKPPAENTDDDDDDDESESPLMRVTTIHLRLSEIEFADATTTAWRTRLRSLSARLQTMGRDYRKKQQERTIAEAEAAWRSIWVDE
jgi:hypothetical protein